MYKQHLGSKDKV